MGDLFFNKLAGAIIGVGLIIMGLMELSHILVHSKPADQLAYTVDLSSTMTASADVEEEPEVEFAVLLANADVSAGERVSRRCASCHSFEQGGANMTGPYMYGVVGREVGVVDGYNYSNAMAEYAEGGVEWGYDNLNAYLERPADYIEGTAMSFAGLRDPEDRANIIAYMRTLSENPLPLPEPETAEADAPVEEASEEAVEG
jgi:cytochrome c